MSSPGYDDLAARFGPLFAEIADGEREREQHRTPPRQQLARLVDAGFAGLRVPVEYGGEGTSLSVVIRLLADLAEADSNLAHLWRNHLSFVEDRRHDAADPRSALWLRRLGAGALVGGGWSEPGVPGTPALSSRLVQDGDRMLLSGTKMYATGSIYADWSTVLATDSDGDRAVVLVGMHDPNVHVGDDWDGFGQRLTGSGSVIYDSVEVEPANVFAFETRYPYQHQFYQSALNALLVGITRAALRDGVSALRARTRNHPSATTAVPTADPELLEIIGRIGSDAMAAESMFLRSLQHLDSVAEDRDCGDDALTTSWVSTSATQLVTSDIALRTTTDIFDALGSSGTSGKLGLDRHWRNARTIISHNPRPYRQRTIGDWLVNDVDPAIAQPSPPASSRGPL